MAGENEGEAKAGTEEQIAQIVAHLAVGIHRIADALERIAAVQELGVDEDEVQPFVDMSGQPIEVSSATAP